MVICNIEKEYTPLISLIIATYNSGKYLDRAIKSVINQCCSLELIIIDGGSTDNTISLIKKYQKYIYYYISEPDKGIYDAWNKGILKSRGKYIAFIGGDDILLNNYCQTYVEFLSNLTGNADFISSKMYFGNKSLTKVGDAWEWNSLKKRMNIVHPGSLHNRELFSLYGYFDSSYEIAGDYEFFLRIGPKLNAKFINQATVRMGSNGKSNTKILKLHSEVYRAKINNTIDKKIHIQINYMIRIMVSILSFVKRKTLNIFRVA